MEPRIATVYLEEIYLQSGYALHTLSEVRRGLSQPRIQDKIDTVFRELQGFLAYAGVVSRTLWPPKEAKRALRQRASALRKILGIAGTSVLEDRGLRNSLEHFDERLDSWASEPAAANAFFDLNLGSINGAIGAAGIPAKSFFRSFDPVTWTYSFWGKVYDIRTLEIALTEIRASAEAALPAQRKLAGWADPPLIG